MEQRVYYGKIEPNALADHLIRSFNQPGYSQPQSMAQRLGEGDQVMVQVMRSGSWGRSSSTLGIQIARIPNGVSVSVGQSEWLDPSTMVAGAVLGAIFFPPLILLPLIGSLFASAFPQDVWGAIESYCAGYNPRTAPPTQPNVPPGFHCPSCGAYNQVGVAQCYHCHRTFNYTATPAPAAASAPPQPTPPVEPEIAPVAAKARVTGNLAATPDPVAASDLEQLVCPACGETVAATKFCGNCGISLRG